MSRNKDIKFLHEYTGKSYKECRADLKANNWDVWRVLCPEFYALSDTVKNISEAMSNFFRAVGEATGTAIKELARVLKETELVEFLRETEGNNNE